MRVTLLTFLLVFTPAGFAQAPPVPGHSDGMAHADMPRNLKPYFIAFLVEGAKPAEPQSKEDHAQLMQKHLGYIRSQVESGKYLLGGPLTDDGRIRGIIVINAASADEAKQIVNADPAVQSGRLAIEVHPAMLPDLSAVHMEFPAKDGK